MHIYASTSMSVTKITQAINLLKINTVHGTQCGGIHHFLTQKYSARYPMWWNPPLPDTKIQNPEALYTSVCTILSQILPARTTISHTDSNG